ncbi:MAG: hypothetical protein ACQESK_04390 [Bacteroidota bacterium]
MKIKNKIIISILILIGVLLLLKKLNQFYGYKSHINDLKENNDIYKIELYLNSYYGRRMELPSKEEIKKYIDKNVDYLNNYGYNIGINKQKDEVVVYSYGFNKTDNDLADKKYMDELLELTFLNYLKQDKLDVILIAFKNYKPCNISKANILHLYDEENLEVLSNKLISIVNNNLEQFEKDFNNTSENKVTTKTLVFKYKNQRVFCVCDSGVKMHKIQFIEENIRKYFIMLETNHGIKEALFSIDLKFKDSDMEVFKNEHIFKS